MPLSEIAASGVTPPSGLVIETCVALVSCASLPVQPVAAATMWPAPVPASLAFSDQLGLVSVAVRAPVWVATPPGVKLLVNIAPVPAAMASVPRVVPVSCSGVLAAIADPAGMARAAAVPRTARGRRNFMVGRTSVSGFCSRRETRERFLRDASGRRLQALTRPVSVSGYSNMSSTNVHRIPPQ